MSPRFCLATVLFAFSLCGVANADTLSTRIAEIEAALAAGDGAGALAQTRALHHAVADRAGFGVNQVILTEAPATGFGLYTPQAQPVYAPGAPVYGYVEPFGFSLEPVGDGMNALLFDVDFALLSTDGEPLTDIMPMGEVELTSRSRPLDAFFYLTYNISGPDGDYLIWTRVTDRPSGQEAEFTIPVTFRAHPPAQSK